MIEDKLETAPETEFNGEPGPGDVVAALIKRATATADLTAATVKLAAAETRLAASSAGLFLLFVALLLVMILITWMVALATACSALMALGLSAVASLSILLLIQVLLCALIAFVLLKLGRQLSFPLTRQALQRSLDATS